LISPPILAYPVPDCKFILDTDASDCAVGRVLSQLQDNQEKVIAYTSKALNKEEQIYCVIRKELLVVVSAHSYLYGQDVLLRTDNAAVSWLKNLKMPSGQIARWLQEIEDYNLTITHRPGRQHGNADALSRKSCKACSGQQDKNTELELKIKKSLLSVWIMYSSVSQGP
jgi:hypothetical protein